MYRIKTEKFEGPLELLLDLIEKEKLNITEFSLSRVTDEYLEHIRDNDQINLEHLAEFLSIASRLILIKSRALLPMLKFTEEEEAEIKDLTYQLEEYKKFKDVFQALGQMASSGRISYSRAPYLGVKKFFYPPENINAYDLKKIFIEVVSEIPVIEKLQEEMVSEVITLENKINELENFIRRKMETSFQELVLDAADKVEVIVSFLAMLEMVKQKIVDVEQGDLFQEIKLSLKDN